MKEAPDRKRFHCKRCGHDWYASSKSEDKLPAHCSWCNTPYWNKPRLYTKPKKSVKCAMVGEICNRGYACDGCPDNVEVKL